MVLDTLTTVLGDVHDERRRQEELKQAGRFRFTCADPGLSLTAKLAILAEEFGEVAREVLTNKGVRLARDTEGTDEALYAELKQVAAVAVAWMESLVPPEGAA